MQGYSFGFFILTEGILFEFHSLSHTLDYRRVSKAWYTAVN